MPALGALTCAVALTCCIQTPGFSPPDPSSIDAGEVRRIISVLADDDMRGRRAFTEDAARAAAFLAGEFEAAGLEPLEGTQGYRQHFPVYAIETESSRVIVDGVTLAASQILLRLAEPTLSWSTGDAPLVVVGPGDDPQEKVVPLLQGGGSALVFIHPQHRATFTNLARFFRGTSRSMEAGAGGALVLVLVDASTDASYEVEASATISEEPLMNVVGMIPGRRSDEFVLFSAHYDHIGIRTPVEGDSIANGANDDASGTTAVVTLARYFAERGTPERTLLFAAFTAEEGGGYGSRHFSTQLDPDQIVAMFNIEMIGKPAVEGPNTAWITGFERSSFGGLLQEAVAGTEYSFYPDPYPSQNLFYRSDNATLARLGVPAHSISTTPIDVDPDYHQVSDHVETLDMSHMTNTIRAIAMGAERIVGGDATPTRVDPATVN
jgi:hypothetical protein